MSAIPVDVAGPASAVTGARMRVTFWHVVESEWVKLRSLRSTRWSMLAAFVFMAGLGVLVCAIQMSRWSHLAPVDRATFNSIDFSLGGRMLAQLAIGVLGVLFITGEYSTGMIRSTMIAVPRRLPVLLAKTVVFSTVTCAAMLVATLVAFFASQSILAEHHVNVTLGSPHALRAVIGTVLYLTVLAAFCGSIGSLVRNSAGGIATYVAVMFVLPGISELLPSSVANAIHPYLPSNAASAVAEAHPEAHMLSPWAGFALFCGYTLLLLGAAAIALARRDV